MDTRNQGSGAVLGAAALAAGAVGSVVAAIMSRKADEEAPNELELRRAQLESLSRSGTEMTRRTMQRARKRVPKDLGQARERASDFGATATKLADSGISSARSILEQSDFEGVSQRLASAAKERSREGVSRTERSGADLAAKVAGAMSEGRERVPDLKDWTGRAAANAMSRGTDIGEQLRERAPEVRDLLEERVAPIVRNVQRQVKPIISDAGVAAATALGAAGTRASDLREWAEKDALPDVRTTLHDVSHQVAEKAKTAEHVLGTASADASSFLSHAGGTVEDRSRQAAAVAAKGTRDTGSLLFWTTVGAGVIFYAFLSKAQRDQVKSAARRVTSEAREIYKDIQGYDEEFS